MNVNETLMGLFFRMVNFGVFFMGLRHLYLKYITPSAEAEIEADDKKVAILAQQKDAYYQQEQHVNQEIKEQQELIMRLSEKLQVWHKAAQAVEQAQREEHDKLELALRKKAAVQSAHIEQHMVAQRAIPHAVQKLKASLTDHFGGQIRGNDYIADALDHITKRL